MSGSPTKHTVIIVDPDADFLDWATRHLHAPSIEVIATERSDEALKLFIEKEASLLIADLRLAPFDGLELLKKARQNLPNAAVLLNTAFPSTNAVIEAMRLGAYDVLRKEQLNFELRPAVESALQSAEQMKLVDQTEPEVPDPSLARDLIIGRSPAMQDVFKLIGRVARSDVPVLITGESGCGKEVVANAIHKFSPRSKSEYVAINCAAIPGNLLESELFGHEKGAFTGAVSQRIGRFEQCDNGTLFLDEIGDMPLEVQSKLLRVLQLGEFSRVGGNQTLTSNVRILAATNKKLEEEVLNGKFREDLFYRLNVVRIHIPPLRQRKEDVSLLADHFLGRMAEKNMGRRMRFSQEAMAYLHDYDWPGNVRELENTIQRACVLATGNVLLPRDIPLGHAPRREEETRKTPAHAANGSKDAHTADAPASVDTALDRLFAAAAEAGDDEGLLSWIEKAMIRRAIAKTDGNQAQAAKLLGVSRATLRNRLEKIQEN